MWLICAQLLMMMTRRENASTLQYLLYMYFLKLVNAARFGS